VGRKEEERTGRLLARREEVALTGTAVLSADPHFDQKGAVRGYAAAFRDYGIDVEALPPEQAAERLRARPIRAELTGALVFWGLMQVLEDRERGGRLLALARSVDPDGWRRRVS